MQNVGYYNGAIGPIEEMTVPMDDRAVYFGDGVYEATLAANRRIFELTPHIERFFRSCAALRIPLALSKEALAAELQRCVDAADAESTVMLYWQCSRGTAKRGHAFPEGVQPNLLATVRETKLAPLSKKMRTITLEDTRFLHCNVKTLNLIPNVMANQAAKEAGCGEAIFHRGDRVTECSHSNVSILQNGVFRTAPTDNLILPGITRAHLLRVCDRLDVTCDERPFTLSELMDADEVIISGSGILCRSASEIDGKPVGGRAAELLARLENAVAEDFYAQTGWRVEV